jgi:hypothetical protein
MHSVNNVTKNQIKTKTLTGCALLLAVTSLAGCASTDYQPLESRAPLVGQGQLGTRKVVDGVDIWTFGAPPRKYRALGVIHDTRGGGVIPMAQYYHDIAAKVRQYGGDAAIEVASGSQQVGTMAIANSTTTSSGNFSGSGWNYGGYTRVNGTVTGASNTFGSATAFPLMKHQGTFLVVKYL